MSATPFDHPLLGRLLGDHEVAAQFSAEAEIAQMTVFESALAVAEGAEGVIPAESAAAIAGSLAAFQPDMAAIAEATARDGVPTIELIRQMRGHVGAPHGEHIHFGATSQDVIDTGLMLRLRPALATLARRLGVLIERLEHLAAREADRQLMGRTRMQDALPITAGARIEAWSLPLGRHRERLVELRPRLLVLQFGGAVGTLDKLGDKGRAVSERLASHLELGLPARSWHTQRDNLAELAGWLSLVSGTLGKLGEDVGLMALMGEVVLEGTGGSSAMPHKQNPVKAEALVALARYNATLVSGAHQALPAELERSGAGMMLEWLVVPQMVVATAAALRTGIDLVGSITSMGTGHG
jgi:3-carboxy-cis,cis-muconate cycloisomerase